jgi:protein-tyrosine phosphatase
MDDSGLSLLKSLNLTPTKTSLLPFNSIDPIYRHPTTGAVLYCGNKSVAESKEMLRKYNVKRVVNCTVDLECFFEKKGVGKAAPRKTRKGDGEAKKGDERKSDSNARKGDGDAKDSASDGDSDGASDHNVKYLRLPISHWQAKTSDGVYTGGVYEDDAKVFEFLTPFFEFVDKSLKEGENVLIHDLAGAHRAGTATIILLIRYTDPGSLEEGIENAKVLRNIIDPIGDLAELLKRYWRGRERGLEGGIDV